MSREQHAQHAAVALAKTLRLPTARATVLTWYDRGEPRIVVCGDRQWLLAHRNIPNSFHGFPVSIEEPLVGTAHA